MTALSYSTTGRDDGVMDLITLPIAAQKVLRGSLACIDTTGYAIKGANTAGYIFTGGYFTEEVDNSGGSAGDLKAHIAIPEKFQIATSGASQASIGMPVWLTDDNTAQFTPTHVYLGICVDYISSTSIWVKPESFKAIGCGDCFEASFALALTTANATITVVPAWFNSGATGLIIEKFFAVVTTKLAGASEDQATVDLYDSADTDLSAQITFADGAADDIGDIRLGKHSGVESAGSALPKVAATARSVYAKVTQATSGSGAAGAVRLIVKAWRY